MSPARTVERETGSGDAELVAVQLKTAIRTTRPLRNYLRSARQDSLTAEYRRSIVEWMYTVSPEARDCAACDARNATKRSLSDAMLPERASWLPAPAAAFRLEPCCARRAQLTRAARCSCFAPGVPARPPSRILPSREVRNASQALGPKRQHMLNAAPRRFPPAPRAALLPLATCVRVAQGAAGVGRAERAMRERSWLTFGERSRPFLRRHAAGRSASPPRSCTRPWRPWTGSSWATGWRAPPSC